MNKINNLTVNYVEFVPESLTPAILYVSKRYSTAAHLCCCGCGLEVVTPLNAAKWELVDDGDKISLSPSIGNWSFPCQSHYWINQNQVQWASSMSPSQVRLVKARDQRDVEALTSKPRNRIVQFFIDLSKTIKNWFASWG